MKYYSNECGNYTSFGKTRTFEDSVRVFTLGDDFCETLTECNVSEMN